MLQRKHGCRTTTRLVPCRVKFRHGNPINYHPARSVAALAATGCSCRCRARRRPDIADSPRPGPRNQSPVRWPDPRRNSPCLRGTEGGRPWLTYSPCASAPTTRPPTRPARRSWSMLAAWPCCSAADSAHCERGTRPANCPRPFASGRTAGPFRRLRGLAAAGPLAVRPVGGLPGQGRRGAVLPPRPARDGRLRGVRVAPKRTRAGGGFDPPPARVRFARCRPVRAS